MTWGAKASIEAGARYSLVRIHTTKGLFGHRRDSSGKVKQFRASWEK